MLVILVGLGLAIFPFFEKIFFLFRKYFVFLFSIGLFFPEMTTLMSVTGRDIWSFASVMLVFSRLPFLGMRFDVMGKYGNFRLVANS